MVYFYSKFFLNIYIIKEMDFFCQGLDLIFTQSEGSAAFITKLKSSKIALESFKPSQKTISKSLGIQYSKLYTENLILYCMDSSAYSGLPPRETLLQYKYSRSNQTQMGGGGIRCLKLSLTLMKYKCYSRDTKSPRNLEN